MSFVGTELNSSSPLSLFIKPVDGSKKSSSTFGAMLSVKPLTAAPTFNEYLSGKTQCK